MTAARTAKADERDALARVKPITATRPVGGERRDVGAVALTDFYSYMPMHNYLFVPTRELWPATSVNGRIAAWPDDADGKPLAPSKWLDQHRPVDQMVWHPAEPQLVHGRVMQTAGWVTHRGAQVFNLYRPPGPIAGDPAQAGPWLDHVHRVYPDDAEHIIGWLAHRVQRPGEKINHALVLGGAQGIGKDTLLEPVKAGIGPWNWQEVSPTAMLGRFNAWCKAVIVRVSEARDLGDVDRFAFYDHSKVYCAAPPDVLRVDEKFVREHYVANVMGVIITTNHAADGLYLPADDRRHYVAWSNLNRTDFPPDYWAALWSWYAAGGIGHVAAYLHEHVLDGIDWKAPPPQTQAFWTIVAAGEAPESGELRDVLDRLDNPEATTIAALVAAARDMMAHGLADELSDRKSRRAVPHRLERVGYVPARNPDAADGLFKVDGRRCAVYAQRGLPLAEQVRAARRLGSGQSGQCDQ